MIYNYIDTYKNYDNIFIDDTKGVFAWFKVSTSSSNIIIPIWVINSFGFDQTRTQPSFSDWKKIAYYLADKANSIDPFDKDLINRFLYYDQKGKDNKYYIYHRKIGVFKQSPKCFIDKTPYPDWFLTFLLSKGDKSLILTVAPV